MTNLQQRRSDEAKRLDEDARKAKVRSLRIDDLPERYWPNGNENVVYFIYWESAYGQNGRIKIGETSNVRKRLREHVKAKDGLESHKTYLLAVVRGTKTQEQSIHSYFSSFKWNGEQEIFTPSNDLVDYVRWLRDQHWVWVIDDVECQRIADLPCMPYDTWSPNSTRKKLPPPITEADVEKQHFFGEDIPPLYYPLDLPPRILTGDDYYTPQVIIDRVRRVMGCITLDPASHVTANRVIKARKFYTVTDDGLSLPWCGHVWLNPPFSTYAQWSAKIVEEWQTGRIQQMCVFVGTRTLPSQHFSVALKHVSAMCIITGRIACWGGESSTPTDGNAVVYFGVHVQTFCKYFDDLGTCWIPHKPQESH